MPEKLLLTTANQSQAFLEQLATELREIRDVALYNARARSHVEVMELGSMDYAPLWDVMNSAVGQDVTMLHYIGHSSPKGLYVDSVDTTPRQLAPDALAALLTQTSRMRFVFLNSCCSEAIAQTLLKAGVPYVIGTSTAVADAQAVRVAKKFYELLGNVFTPRTIEEAFEQTQLYFDNDPENPVSQSDRHRGSADLDTDTVSFPWQFYKRSDLTDKQRTWRLIPIQTMPVSKPVESVVLYRFNPSIAALKPFSVFLLSPTDEQALASELLEQLQAAFGHYGSFAPVWNAESLTDSERITQTTAHLQTAGILLLVVNRALLQAPFAVQLMEQARTRCASPELIVPPVVFATELCEWQPLSGGFFRCYPPSGELLEAPMLKHFANDLYGGWMRWVRGKR